MKIFKDQEEWYEKVNFVDKNNVLVGYDMGQSCCEHADWFISEEIIIEGIEDYVGKEFELEEYVFDKGYMNSPDLVKDEDGYSELDEGGIVVFKLIADSKPDLYLHIFNSHNGYYSHGFEFKDGDKVLRKGDL